jgi:hypothetical protein
MGVKVEFAIVTKGGKVVQKEVMLRGLTIRSRADYIKYLRKDPRIFTNKILQKVPKLKTHPNVLGISVLCIRDGETNKRIVELHSKDLCVGHKHGDFVPYSREDNSKYYCVRCGMLVDSVQA